MTKAVFQEQAFRDLVKSYQSRYESMTFEEHRDMHSWLWKTNMPPQEYFNLRQLRQLRAWNGAKVMEIGGWDGQCAAKMLGEFPGIKKWVNFELCREAAESHPIELNTDHRYSYRTNDWAWNQPSELKELDTFVASHSLEHLSKDHLALFINAVRHMSCGFIQLPNNSDKLSGLATHFLEMHPIEVMAEFNAEGWQTVRYEQEEDETIIHLEKP